MNVKVGRVSPLRAVWAQPDCGAHGVTRPTAVHGPNAFAKASEDSGMSTPLTQHQLEIRRNLDAWQNKPLLRRLYAGFYERIVALLDVRVAGRIVEIGSG